MDKLPWYEGYEIPNRLWLSPNNVKVQRTEDGNWMMKGSLEYSFTKQSIDFEASLDPAGKLKKFSSKTYIKKAEITPLIESVYVVWKRTAEVQEQNERDAEELQAIMSDIQKPQVPGEFKQMLSSIREEAIPVEKQVIAQLRQAKNALPLEKQVIAELRQEKEATVKVAEGEGPASEPALTRADIEDVVRTTGAILDGISSDLMAQLDSLREIKGIFAPANDMAERLESIYQLVLTARQSQLEAERGLFPGAEDRIQ